METDPQSPLQADGSPYAVDDPSTAPDALTRLLEELARTPPDQIADAWQKKLADGEVVGRFELRGEVGRGGFGVVYEARDRALGRLVAFKGLRPGRPLTDAQVDGLRREAAAAAALNHPNVVTVHDFGSCPSGPYVIMELLRGSPLSQRIEGGPLPPCEAVRIGIEVARALAHAHAGGVVHRDLKPGNVFLCRDGSVKVLDFGLARILGAGGVRGGTPGYMAPEQVRGDRENDRTDLFGLGALLYRMLTGQVPFIEKDGRNAVLDDGPSPEPQGKGIPRQLSTVVGRLLAKDPAARPASAAAVAQELGRIHRALDPAVLARRRRRRLVAAAVALAAAVGGGAAGLWMRFATARAWDGATVAVADFDNRTGDAELDGLSGMLIASLEQSRRLRVLTRSRMRDELRRLGHEDVRTIDEALAREVGRATGAKALLVASLERADGTYGLELRAVDPARGRRFFTWRDRAEGKGEIPALVDRLSDRVRLKLREQPEEVGSSHVPVGEALTRSLEAYRHYFAGLECMDRPSQLGSMWQACAPSFRSALAVDPGFALAHYQLAYVSAAEEADQPEARAHIEAAAARAGSAPVKERLLISGWKHHLDGRDDQALASYRQLLERYPEDKHAIYVAGDLLHHQGDNERALPLMRRALEIDPSFEWAQDHLAIELIATDRGDELASYVRRWEGLPPDPGRLHALARARFGLGDPAGALEAARRYVALGAGVQGHRDVASVLFSTGEFRAAERQVRAALAANSRDDFLLFLLAYSLHAQGRAREALEVVDGLEPAVRAGREPPATCWYLRAVLLASSGARDKAWSASRAVADIDPGLAAELATDLALHGDFDRARRLAGRFPPGTSRYEVWQAVTSWKNGDAAGARSRLRALDRLDPTPDRAPLASYLLAEIASEVGDDADVVASVRRYQRFWAAGLRSSWTSPRAMVLLARSQLRLGQAQEAQTTLDRFLDQWSSADADHPLLAEARALRARFTGATAPRRVTSTRRDGSFRGGADPQALPGRTSR